MNTELQFLLYDDPSENNNINVVIKDDTIWATQKTIAELYDVHPSSVARHLGNIYEEKELEELSTIAKFAIVEDSSNSFSSYIFPRCLATDEG